MKINCLHGYFKFEEVRAGEVSDFISLFGLEIVRVRDHFTFAPLENAPDFAIERKAYLNAIAKKTFAGQPWEIMQANEWIYNFETGKLVPIGSITHRTPLFTAGNVFVSPGLILPGSLTDEGDRVKDYAAWFSFDTGKFKYSEVRFVD